MRKALLTAALTVTLCSPLGLTAPALALDAGGASVQVIPMADGFETPWSVAFLPDGSFLVTEREGRLWLVGPDGQRTQLRGLPDIRVTGQGGLLDVMVPRDFAQSGEIIFSYAKPQGRAEGTAMAIARLSDDRTRLENLRLLFEMKPGSSGGRHFGGRVVEARDGTLFLTTGDRGDDDSAQDLMRHNGKVIRVTREGAVPADNPFVGRSDALPEIWSYGHRNPQGATLDAEGRLWLAEHGARGGDEVNLVQRGANYGWPVISYGRHYSGQRIGEGTDKPGMEQPRMYWDPSMAPSGMTFYTGNLWPRWQGQALVGSLKFDYIARIGGDSLAEVEQIKGRETDRVRDIRQAADGSIWFISEGRGTIYRITP
jgi:glucose/arabinose dehydrogenase